MSNVLSDVVVERPWKILVVMEEALTDAQTSNQFCSWHIHSSVDTVVMEQDC